MTLIDMLSKLELKLDSSGRFCLSWPITHGTDDLSTTKFRIIDGQLFDGYGRRWSEEEFREALRRAGRLPAQPIANGTNCVQCGRTLAGSQSRYCSPTCRTVWKREAMRERRGYRAHRHVCRDCGRSFKVGRPPKAAQTL